MTSPKETNISTWRKETQGMLSSQSTLGTFKLLLPSSLKIEDMSLRTASLEWNRLVYIEKEWNT